VSKVKLLRMLQPCVKAIKLTANWPWAVQPLWWNLEK